MITSIVFTLFVLKLNNRGGLKKIGDSWSKVVEDHYDDTVSVPNNACYFR